MKVGQMVQKIVARVTSSNSDSSSDGSDGQRGPTRAYVNVTDDFDAEQEESNAQKDDCDADLTRTVAERVKDSKRKRKTPSSLRSPMQIFRDVRKNRDTDASRQMKRGSVPPMQSNSKKKTVKPTGLASQPCVSEGSARANPDNKNSKKNKKLKTTDTRMVDLRGGPDLNQQDIDALAPRERAAVQYISNLCKDKKTIERCVLKTKQTCDRSLTAAELKGHIIPRITDEKDSEKYISTGVVDTYAGYLSLRVTDDRRFNPAWYAFILSNKTQVDRVLQPESRDAYADFATKFYDNELVFFPFNMFHRGHNHWILVVMNNTKKELQVLDSLWSPEAYIDKIESMRSGIDHMTSYARRRTPDLPTNVGTWKIKPITNLPKQTDGTSCGLYVLKYMELWNGTKLVRDFTQDEVHVFRMTMLADMIYSPTNDRQESKDGVDAIMQASRH